MFKQQSVFPHTRFAKSKAGQSSLIFALSCWCFGGLASLIQFLLPWKALKTHRRSRATPMTTMPTAASRRSGCVWPGPGRRRSSVSRITVGAWRSRLWVRCGCWVSVAGNPWRGASRRRTRTTVGTDAGRDGPRGGPGNSEPDDGPAACVRRWSSGFLVNHQAIAQAVAT